MPLSALGDETSPYASGSIAGLLNGNSLSTPDWMRFRNLQLSGGAGDDLVEPDADGGAGTPSGAPANEDGDGLPLSYDPETGRFTVLTDPNTVADATPPSPSPGGQTGDDGGLPQSYGADRSGFVSGAIPADASPRRAPPVTPITTSELAPAFLRPGSFNSDYSRPGTPRGRFLHDPGHLPSSGWPLLPARVSG